MNKQKKKDDSEEFYEDEDLQDFQESQIKARDKQNLEYSFESDLSEDLDPNKHCKSDMELKDLSESHGDITVAVNHAEQLPSSS